MTDAAVLDSRPGKVQVGCMCPLHTLTVWTGVFRASTCPWLTVYASPGRMKWPTAGYQFNGYPPAELAYEHRCVLVSTCKTEKVALFTKLLRRTGAIYSGMVATGAVPPPVRRTASTEAALAAVDSMSTTVLEPKAGPKAEQKAEPKV